MRLYSKSLFWSIVACYLIACLAISSIAFAQAKKNSQSLNKIQDYDSVNVKTFGAFGNGIANETIALQKAINAGRNIYFPPGTYRVYGKLVVNKPTSIIGRNATIVQMVKEVNTLWVSSTNCNIEGLKFIGTSTGSERSFPKSTDSYGSAVVLQSSTNCRVANNTMINYGSPVTNCGSAIYLTGSSQCIVDNNFIQGGFMAVGVDAYFGISKTNKIVNNTIINSKQGIVVDLQGKYSDDCIGDHVSGNKIYGAQKGIQFDDCQRDGIISNNVLKSISGIAISAIHRTRRLLIQNNIIDSAAACGIVLNDLGGTQTTINVQGNIINYCGEDGIQAYTVYGLDISGNSISYVRNGITIPPVSCYSQSVTISNNHLLNNKQSGILCYNAKDYIISNNLFRNNSVEHRNKYSGLDMHNGNVSMSNILVANNLFADDSMKYAVSCSGSYYLNVMLTGNLFSSNTRQVYDESGGLMLRSNNIPNKN
jgi:parallel beta-helix repeat protein